MLSIFKNLFRRNSTVGVTEVAEACEYEISLLTERQKDEVMRLNNRCFEAGESYTRHTFEFLLNDPNTISYRVIGSGSELVAFIFLMLSQDGSAHVTTIGVAPEHRRRGLAQKLLTHSERALRIRGISTLMLEVRVSNVIAQQLYRKLGYVTLQRLERYYNDGEDGFLMMKPLDARNV